MVLIKNLPTSTINTLSNFGGEILYDQTINRPLVNIASGFRRFVLSDSNNNITDINDFYANNLYGTLQTATQPNVTSLGTLTSLTSNGDVTIASHDGSSTGLILGSTLITATGTELNYVDTTAGTIQASKAMIVDSSRNITNLNNLGLTGTIESTDNTASTSSITGA